MSINRAVRTYFLVTAIIMLITAFMLFIQLRSMNNQPSSGAIIPAKSITEKEPVVPGYSIPVNPILGDKEIKENAKKQADEQKRLKERLAERDKKVAVAREDIVSRQNELLLAETQNNQEKTPKAAKAVLIGKYIGKGPSKETKQKVQSGRYFFGH